MSQLPIKLFYDQPTVNKDQYFNERKQETYIFYVLFYEDEKVRKMLSFHFW